MLLLNSKKEQSNGTSKKPSYVSVPGETPLLGMTIGQMIDEAARKYGDNEALVVPFQNIKRTYKQLKEEVRILQLII